MRENIDIELDLNWVNKVRINAWCVHDALKDISEVRKKLSPTCRAAWLLRAVSCIDLTTLAGDDTRSNVARLCYKAMRPISSPLLKSLGFPVDDEKPFTTAAVCVYPARVGDAALTIKGTPMEKQLEIAAVATGFPSGQYSLNSRLLEIKNAIEQGATEIDVVVDRSLVLTGKWDVLYHELTEMKKACKDAEMKTILAVGELSTFENIYKASWIAMMAGSNFIKTSTGKESINATLPVGLVMMRAICEFYQHTGIKVGFKAAGGIRSSDDALDWLILVSRELGKEWLKKELFRFGASGLLSDIEKSLYILAYKHLPADYEFS